MGNKMTYKSAYSKAKTAKQLEQRLQSLYTWEWTIEKSETSEGRGWHRVCRAEAIYLGKNLGEVAEALDMVEIARESH